jgi:hypothetical protein
MSCKERIMQKKARIAAVVLVPVALLASLAPALRAQVTVPAGTRIVVTVDQAISSKDAKVGEAVPATVADNVGVNGKVVIPKGSAASVHVASVQPSGRLSTPAKLWLRLDSVTVNGKTYSVSAHWAGEAKGSHAKRNTVAIGGGTAAGAIIGALAGGGKGAAIGAAAGAGAGTAGAAATGKKDVNYAAETKLTFSLKSPVTIK